MQAKEARMIAEQWAARKAKNPDLKCDHTRIDLEKEYDLGTATGDYICRKCGEAFFEGRIPESEEER